MFTELEFEFVIKPYATAELSDYVLEFTGKAMLWDDELGEDVKVASMRGHRIDLAAAQNDGGDIQQIFESLYPDIIEFERTIFSDDSCWLGEPNQYGELIECRCLVYIDELVVDSKHRSQGIGSGMMKRMSQMIDLEDCLVGLKAFPLSDDYGRKRSIEEIERLRKFYHKLGFVHAGKHFFEKDGNQCAAPKKRRGNL